MAKTGKKESYLEKEPEKRGKEKKRTGRRRVHSEVNKNKKKKRREKERKRLPTQEKRQGAERRTITGESLDLSLFSYFHSFIRKRRKREELEHTRYREVAAKEGSD